MTRSCKGRTLMAVSRLWRGGAGITGRWRKVRIGRRRWSPSRETGIERLTSRPPFQESLVGNDGVCVRVGHGISNVGSIARGVCARLHTAAEPNELFDCPKCHECKGL